MMEQSALAAAARISFHVLIMLDHSAVIPGVAWTALVTRKRNLRQVNEEELYWKCSCLSGIFLVDFGEYLYIRSLIHDIVSCSPPLALTSKQSYVIASVKWLFLHTTSAQIAGSYVSITI